MTLSPTEIEREVKYIYQYLLSDKFINTTPVEKSEGKYRELLEDFKLMAKHVQPLRLTDRGIMTLTRQKTAALVADRVWGAHTDADLTIAFGWELPMEVRLRAISKLIGMFDRAPTEPPTGPVAAAEIENFMTEIERDLARGFYDSTGATVLPLYSSSSRRDAQYHAGDQAALVCLVENLEIVDEEQLTWPQVVDFRRDKAARSAYRQFVHWLDRDMVEKSVQYITDEVTQRLERYEWSLRKHGIKTVIGGLSDTLNPKSLVGASTTALAVDLLAGKPIWSLLTAGRLLVGRVMASLATAFVERRDIEMSHREIAYVQQVRLDLSHSTKIT